MHVRSVRQIISRIAEETLLVGVPTYIVLISMEFIKPGMVSYRIPLSAGVVVLLACALVVTLADDAGEEKYT